MIEFLKSDKALQVFKKYGFKKENKMKLIKTEDAIGHVLCHDIAQIIKGVQKMPFFRRVIL